MSYYRSYFEKNNTIIKNSKVNTAKSPTTDIFYGNKCSRFIFKIDLIELKNRLTSGDLVKNSNTKHILHLTNTVFGDKTLVGKQRMTGKQRATSFDLIIFNVPEFWDEGIGFEDGVSDYDFSLGDKNYSELPSNWYNRTILNTWSTEGMNITESDVIKRIHFDNGNEDINVDITNYINNILDDVTIYHGTGICFDFVYENLLIPTEKSVSFFTKYTQTFFEPYLESIFNDQINDDRSTFTNNIEQQLFLTVNSGDDGFNLDIPPTVDIVNIKTNVPVFENLQSEQIRKGVYGVKLTLTNQNIDGRTFFKDVWKGITINGSTIENIEQKFLPQTIENKLSFNTGFEKTPKITFRTVGILQNEKIKRGDVRKISLNFKSLDDIKNVYKRAYYRIFIWEGRTTVNVFDWTQMDSGLDNSFLLDTSFLIPREYTIEVMVKNNKEVLTLNDKINFEIVSER